MASKWYSSFKAKGVANIFSPLAWLSQSSAGAQSMSEDRKSHVCMSVYVSVCMHVCGYVCESIRNVEEDTSRNPKTAHFHSLPVTSWHIYIFTANLITDCVLYLKLYFKCDLKRNLLKTMIFSSKISCSCGSLSCRKTGVNFLVGTWSYDHLTGNASVLHKCLLC